MILIYYDCKNSVVSRCRFVPHNQRLYVLSNLQNQAMLEDPEYLTLLESSMTQASLDRVNTRRMKGMLKVGNSWAVVLDMKEGGRNRDLYDTLVTGLLQEVSGFEVTHEVPMSPGSINNMYTYLASDGFVNIVRCVSEMTLKAFPSAAAKMQTKTEVDRREKRGVMQTIHAITETSKKVELLVAEALCRIRLPPAPNFSDADVTSLISSLMIVCKEWAGGGGDTVDNSPDFQPAEEDEDDASWIRSVRRNKQEIATAAAELAAADYKDRAKLRKVAIETVRRI